MAMVNGTVITADHLGNAKTVITGFVARAVADIEATVRDRDRLAREAIEREAVIERLNQDLDAVAKRCTELEMRNVALADVVVRLESELAQQIAIIDSVRAATAAATATGTGSTTKAA